MQFLLDTHTLIFFLSDDSQLPKNAVRIIENLEHTCYISIASFWEMGIKVSLGKLTLNLDLEDVMKMTTEIGIEILPILPDHILTCSKLAFHHRDPFDRLIVSQAMEENLTLISKDQAFKAYDVPLVWS